MSTRRKIALVLIFFGIGLTVGLIAFQLGHAANIWSSGLDGKIQTFDSFSAYFLSTSKGAMVFSLICGAIPALIGFILFWTPDQSSPIPPNDSFRNDCNQGVPETRV